MPFKNQQYTRRREYIIYYLSAFILAQMPVRNISRDQTKLKCVYQ